MLYKKTHPNFDNGTAFEYALGVLEGHRFADQSYKNDTCPCLIHYIDQDNEEYIRLWIDYKDPEKREDSTWKEFGVQYMSEGFELKSWHFDTLDDAITKAKDLTPNKKILYRIPVKGWGYIYDENPFERVEGEQCRHYWHIEEDHIYRNGQKFKRYFHLTIENQGWTTDNDNKHELQMLEGVLLEWIAGELGIELDEVKIIDPPNLDELTLEWNVYIREQKLPLHLDAQGMLLEELTTDQRAWVTDFVERWETVWERT